MTAPICQSAPDLWFDDDPTEAISVCCRCPLVTPCLYIAMAREGTVGAQYRFGVWGGLTPEQRETMAIADRRNNHSLHAKTGQDMIIWKGIEAGPNGAGNTERSLTLSTSHQARGEAS